MTRATALRDTATGDARTSVVRSRRRVRPRWPGWGDAVLTALLSSVMFFMGFGGGIGRLSVALGGGDLLPTYAAARLWSRGAPFGSSLFGYPFGINQRYYPTADVLQNAVAGLVARATDNPFLGIHSAYALSFPATALAALWVFRLVGLRGPWTVFGALALTFVPYHWFRLEHVYLAMMYSAVLGVGLAVLVGNGTVERRLREGPRRLRFILLLAFVVVVVATSGIYYACFTAVLCTVATVWRVARGARFRDLLLAVLPGIAVMVVLGAVLLPAILYVREHPPLDPVAQRNAAESITYAGALLLALLPAPVSRVPGTDWLNAFTGDSVNSLKDWAFTEADGPSNFGSLTTLAAILVLAVGGLVVARRSAMRPAWDRPARVPAGPGDMGLVLLLLVTTVLFFVPWGLNYLFAYVVSPDLRAWNRILPMTFTLVFLGAGLMLQRLQLRLRPVAEFLVLAVAGLVLLFDSVLPARVFFATVSAQGTSFTEQGHVYAEALDKAVPGDCGVFELPYFPYPEFPRKHDMGNYESLWPALTNPEKSWSATAMKGTEASEWQARVGDALDQQDIALLAAGGFCAVHVDRRGYSVADADQVVSDLTQWLGQPVATALDGNWVAFAIPGPVAKEPVAATLMHAPGGVGTFYAPPRITPGAGAPPAPQGDLHHVAWWLPQEPALFDVESLPDGAAFTRVEGQLRAGGCPGDVVVTLRSGRQEVSRTIRTDPAVATAFSLEIDQPVRQAQLAVTMSPLTAPSPGPVCAPSATDAGAAGGEVESPNSGAPAAPGAVALIDPRAVG